MQLVLQGLTLAVAATSPIAYASCWESGQGPAAVYRHPSVPVEFKDAAFVVIGRVLGERRISSAEDPEGYAWTIYDVQVLEAFKGKPPRALHLLSENTTARFPMDKGETYLLFVSRSPSVETAGNERLPKDYVDNCGNSATAREAADKIKALRVLSNAR
jgi:hypothetical protein